MKRQIVIEGTTGIGIAATILAAGLAIGGGAFFGGYLLGERNAPAATKAEASEKQYTAADLEAAMAACSIEDEHVVDGLLELDSAVHRAPHIECFFVEIGAPTLAIEELESITTEPIPEGEYEWSNVHLSWVHAREDSPEKWRDVTVTLK